MGKEFWIKIGLEIFFRWLNKKKNSPNGNPLINNLIAAKSVDDLMNIATDATTENVIMEIMTEVAEEPAGNIFGIIFGWLFKRG